MNQITDAAGTVIQTYDYDSFGNVVAESGSLTNSYKYKSKEADATGLIYFGARYYNPLLGRFITPDPLGMVDGTNLYIYCGNDGVNYFDPWGECGDTPWYFAAGIYPLAFPGFADDAVYWGAVGTGLAIYGIYEGAKWVVTQVSNREPHNNFDLSKLRRKEEKSNKKITPRPDKNWTPPPIDLDNYKKKSIQVLELILRFLSQVQKFSDKL